VVGYSTEQVAALVADAFVEGPTELARAVS